MKEGAGVQRSYCEGFQTDLGVLGRFPRAEYLSWMCMRHKSRLCLRGGKVLEAEGTTGISKALSTLRRDRFLQGIAVSASACLRIIRR